MPLIVPVGASNTSSIGLGLGLLLGLGLGLGLGLELGLELGLGLGLGLGLDLRLRNPKGIPESTEGTPECTLSTLLWDFPWDLGDLVTLILE